MNFFIKRPILTTIVFLAVISIAVFGYHYWSVKVAKVMEDQKKKTAENQPAETEKDYFQVNDESLGVSFKISKNFDRVASADLQKKNPNFIYGFLAKDDKEISCIVSQTKREKPGTVKLSDLRDGVFEQIKKNYEEANLDQAEIVDVGENNKGAKLKMTYKHLDKQYVQWELVGVTDQRATFSFCVAPKAVEDLYKDNFDLFVNSLRIR